MKKQITSAFGLILLAGTLAAGAPLAGAQIVVRIGPPPPRPVEVVPVVPREHPDWVWVPGFHRWDGARYVWVPGHYAAPPFAHAHWVEGHWGPGRGGYVWHEGHWAR
jgi:hypothetical protein